MDAEVSPRLCYKDRRRYRVQIRLLAYSGSPRQQNDCSILYGQQYQRSRARC